MKSDRLEEWGLLPSKPNWAAGFEKIWQPGEDGAQKALQRFLGKDISHYSAARDYPARDLTSRLSPYLHFGEISPRQIYYAIRHRLDSGMDNHTESSAAAFLRQIGWREFCYYLLYHFPDMPEQGMNDKFTSFLWRSDKHHRISWQKGETGYPLIDAGMRQLWQTGWMHNRVRMVVGSFLVKNLRLHWKEGERWFWNTLLDADLANNTGGWQWVAGCGADAAPYFRIFNPVSQSKKFDPDGSYIRTFLPVLKDMPDRYIHEPWKAPDDVLKNAGIVLGKDYPLPLVDLKKTREEALEAYHALS